MTIIFAMVIMGLVAVILDVYESERGDDWKARKVIVKRILFWTFFVAAVVIFSTFWLLQKLSK